MSESARRACTSRAVPVARLEEELRQVHVGPRELSHAGTLARQGDGPSHVFCRYRHPPVVVAEHATGDQKICFHETGTRGWCGELLGQDLQAPPRPVQNSDGHRQRRGCFSP